MNTPVTPSPITPTQPPDPSQLSQILQSILLAAQPGASTAPIYGQAQAPAFPPAGPVNPVGLLIPVTFQLADGRSVGSYLQFGPEAARNPQATIAALAAQGWPVRAYGGGNGWNQQRRGWGGGQRW